MLYGKREDERSAAAVAYRTSRTISAMSVELFGKVPEVVLLDSKDRFSEEGLLLAEQYFMDFTVKKEGNAQGVGLLVGKNRYDEAERVADEIVAMVREHGYSYKDIAVLFRDADIYRESVTRTFELFGIPFIFDEGEDMLSAPGTVFMLSVFEMSSRIRTASLLRLLKTGLCDITPEEISLIEDYSFVHGTEGDGWFREFDMNPFGFGIPEGEEEKAVLSETERIRRTVCEWMKPLYAPGIDDGKDLVRCCYEIMERCGAADAIERNDRAGRQNAELMFGIIQQLYDLAEREKLTKTEMADTLRILASSTRSADIPRVGDGVFIGIAGHSRPFNPAICFVMGLNDGVFPRDISEGNLFTLEERDILSRNELVLGGSFDQSSDLESYFLYDAVTSASERLFLSYSESGSEGEMLPCAELEGFIRAYEIEPQKRGKACGIVNARTARQAYAEALSSGEEILSGSLLSSTASGVCREYSEAVAARDMVMKDRSLAESLTGDSTVVTASRMETFEQCRFMYFLQYLAGIKPLRRAELSPDEAGSFVHEVMELLMKEFSGDLTGADETAVRNACRKHADEYIKKMVGDKTLTPRMRVISDQIKENCIRLAQRLRKEQEQSRFRASGFELNIGEDIPPAVFETEDGSRAEIRGKIDRIDTYVSEGETYVRIVDYKTGGKDFKLSDVWQGLNVQMLLYLFAVKSGGTERYGKDIVPAGVLYMPGDPSPASDMKGAEGIYTMKGLVLNDPAVLEAMEERGEGLFIPAKIDPRSGEWKADSLATMEELGKIENRIETLVTEMVSGLRNGDVRAIPYERGNREKPCSYCPYKAVCRSDRITETRKIRNLSRKEMFGEEERDA
ncbi:MAG: PD-(D/E)XK nuclease family protein [Oscillospiraceae bacterium]|nr:PD-(D/E)XK nuclease family protein [Oscillospiraceae bacterium]